MQRKKKSIKTPSAPSSAVINDLFAKLKPQRRVSSTVTNNVTSSAATKPLQDDGYDGLYHPEDGAVLSMTDAEFFGRRRVVGGKAGRSEEGAGRWKDTEVVEYQRKCAAKSRNVPGSTAHCPFDCDCCF